MPKKVLLIDDDENTVKYLSVALKQNGYEAVGAHDGKAGFEKVGESNPDLIVLDIMMPQKDRMGCIPAAPQARRVQVDSGCHADVCCERTG